MTSRNRLSRTKLNAARPCVAGVSLVALLCLLGPLAVPAHARIIFPAPRFPFTIDPRTPLQELLPVPPDTVEPIAPWLVKDWSQVPAVFFQKPAAVKRAAPSRPRTPEEEQRLALQPDSLKSREEAMKQTALTIAKINHLNQKGADHFLKTLVDTRRDLVGLPFVMGDACRQSKERGGAFAVEVNAVRTTLERGGEQKPRPGDRGGDDGKFWENYDKFPSSLEQKRKETEAEARERTPAQIAALVQILGPEQAVLRQGLVKHLSGIDHPEATRTLARLAVFSFEEEVRSAARKALRSRPKQDATEILLAGLRYPWPAIAENASAALIDLGRKDLVPLLVALLDEPDPRAPIAREVNRKKTLAVRELVRLNHHRNCLLCHAPGNTPDVQLDSLGVASGISTGAIPSPGHPFSFGSGGGYSPFASPDILVRADVTYLRQDFSMKLPVKDAAPWPEQQRFDFLVRTRHVDGAGGEGVSPMAWPASSRLPVTEPARRPRRLAGPDGSGCAGTDHKGMASPVAAVRTPRATLTFLPGFSVVS